jgi:hypothetical protein
MLPQNGARELLNHVTDTERALAFRSLWFARGFETSLESYDQNIAAAWGRGGYALFRLGLLDFALTLSATAG